MSLYPLISPAAGATEFPSLTNLKWRHRADTGVTESSNLVSAWTDMEGDADLTAAGGQRPTLDATGGPNGTAEITFNGSANRLFVDGITAIGAGPFHHFLICKTIAWGDVDSIVGMLGSGNAQIETSGTSPDVQHDFTGGGSTNAIDMTVGTYFLLQSFVDGTTGSFTDLNNGSVTVTGGNPGGNDEFTRYVLGAQDNGAANFWNGSICEAAHVAGSRVAGAELTALMAYFSDYYGLF
jgi:hypothetical protein